MINKLHLNAIVTQALVDSEFEKSILNGKRRECLQMFDLNQAEIEMLLAIDADGIDQFIRQIDAMTKPPATEYPRTLSMVPDLQAVLMS